MTTDVEPILRWLLAIPISSFKKYPSPLPTVYSVDFFLTTEL